MENKLFAEKAEEARLMLLGDVTCPKLTAEDNPPMEDKVTQLDPPRSFWSTMLDEWVTVQGVVSKTSEKDIVPTSVSSLKDNSSQVLMIDSAGLATFRTWHAHGYAAVRPPRPPRKPSAGGAGAGRAVP